MDTSKIGHISLLAKEVATKAAISDLASQLEVIVQLADSEQELKEAILEIAYVLHKEYGDNNNSVTNNIFLRYKEVHGSY